MKAQAVVFFALLLLLATGCTAPQYNAQQGQQLNQQQLPTEPETISKSLFHSEDRTISEANIQRLLDGKIVIPDTTRVAIYKYGGTSSINRYYRSYWNNEEYLEMQQTYIDTLIHHLSNADRIQKVFNVPSIMTVQDPNITQLRESAVRLQADMLLVFHVNSDIYYQYKLFQKNEAKAYATCETILMDTRTGVIPHSSVITKDALVKKDQEDFNEDELRKRAEHKAITLSLDETGLNTSAFLDEY